MSSTLSLVRNFVTWKALLLILAAISPGPGYDTSTSLLLLPKHLAPHPHPLRWAASSAATLLHRLVRWDAIYFISAAQHGYQLEQQWAFGWGFSSLVGRLTAALAVDPSTAAHATVAVVVNLATHLASVIVLHRLCWALSGQDSAARRRADLAAHLHILAPAGLFLIAPSGESLFSLLSFLGAAFYLHGLQARRLPNDASIVFSGVLYGAACTVRGNGILNGFMFAMDLAITVVQGFPASLQLRYCCALVLGGLSVGAGFALPQTFAYLDYCVPVPLRPWCTEMIPSIFSFVQAHYWNCGFLKYWTLSNVPLFLLAIPMLTLTLASSWAALRQLVEKPSPAAQKKVPRLVLADKTGLTWRLAVPQALLGVLTLTNFHVQIITRISSGYVLPYLLIGQLAEGSGQAGTFGTSSNTAKLTIRWMIMYAIIQAGLYASFLPPA